MTVGLRGEECLLAAVSDVQLRVKPMPHPGGRIIDETPIHVGDKSAHDVRLTIPRDFI